MKAIVTGGAGFVGFSVVSKLHSDGWEVLVLDNFSRGSARFLHSCGALRDVPIEEIALEDESSFQAAVARFAGSGKIDAIWHLAANSDIPAGAADPRIDLRDTFLTTFNALLVAKRFEIPRFVFASSSAVYGDFGDVRIREDSGPLLPLSNYGAMKLASEAQVSASAESFLEAALIIRFPNVVGTPATHGVIHDFVKKLQRSPSLLEVLGNGTQQKAYLHVDDLVDAMFYLNEQHDDGIEIFNVGPEDDGITVKEIAELVVAQVSPGAEIRFGHGDRGWIGDVPRFRYSIDKLKAAGWSRSPSSRDAVRRAVQEIAEEADGVHR